MFDQDQTGDRLTERQEAPATQHLIKRQSMQGGVDRQYGVVDSWTTATVRAGASYGRMGHGSLQRTIGREHHDRTYGRLRCPVWRSGKRLRRLVMCRILHSHQLNDGSA